LFIFLTMYRFLCLAALCVGAAAQIAPNMTDVTKKPNPEWARSPHMAPGAENAKGHVDVGGEPAPVEGQVPASPGVFRKANIHSRMPNNAPEENINTNVNDNRTEIEKRPLLPNPAVVLTPEGPSAYNATGAYAGKGSPLNGTYDATYAVQKGPLCCRICPESNDCQDKDNCFHTCHRTCGDVCEIHHHYEPAPSCDAAPAEETKPNVTITPGHSSAVAEAEYGDKLNTIKKILRGTPLPVKKIPLVLQPGL
jgi:hypothetical protein